MLAENLVSFILLVLLACIEDASSTESLVCDWGPFVEGYTLACQEAAARGGTEGAVDGAECAVYSLAVPAEDPAVTGECERIELTQAPDTSTGGCVNVNCASGMYIAWIECYQGAYSNAYPEERRNECTE